MDNLLEVDRDSPDYIRQWIITSWPGTAAQAYESFLKVGRGLLLIDLANGEPVPDFNLGLRARSEYVVTDRIEEHSMLARLGADDMGHLLELVSTYEPEREVIFCFTQRKSGVLFFKAGDKSGNAEHAPPAALKKRGQKAPPLPELRGRAFGRG